MPIYCVHTQCSHFLRASFYYTLFTLNQSHHLLAFLLRQILFFSSFFLRAFWLYPHHRHSYHKIKWKVFILTFSLLNQNLGTKKCDKWMRILGSFSLVEKSDYILPTSFYFGSDHLSYYGVVCVRVCGHFQSELGIVVIEIHYQYLTL